MTIEYQQAKALHLCTKGLPNYNYIRMFMEYNGNKNTRPEYNFQNGKAAISAYVLNYVFAFTESIQGEKYKKPLYVNEMCLNVGTSADDKSNSADPTQKIVESVMGMTVFADSSSTEALKKGMCIKIIKTSLKQPTKAEIKKAKEDDEEEPKPQMVTETIYMPHEIHPRNAKVMWSSEFGRILADTKKTYMAGYVETLCDIYSGKMDNKTNASDGHGTIQYVLGETGRDPFMSICGSMTEKGLIHLDRNDIGRGIARFQWMSTLGYDPLPVPENVEVEENDDDNDDYFARADKAKNNNTDTYALRGVAMVQMGKIIAHLVQGLKLEIEFDSAAIAILVNHEKDMRRHLAGNKMALLLTSRQLENAYKDCILIALGNLPYYVYMHSKDFDNENDIVVKEKTQDIDIDEFFEWAVMFDTVKIMRYKLHRLIITPDIAKYVCKLYDRIYTQSAIEIGGIIMSFNEKPSRQEEVVALLTSAPRITKQNVRELYIEHFTRYKKKMEEERKYMPSDRMAQIDEIVAEKKNALQKEAMFFKELPDDAVITTRTQREIVRGLHISLKDLQPITDSLINTGSLVAFNKPRNTVQYVYLPSNDSVTLPSKNYVDYIGDGAYRNACIIASQHAEYDEIPEVEIPDFD